MAEGTTGRDMLKALEARVVVLEGGEAEDDPKEDIKQIRQALRAIRGQIKLLISESEAVKTRLDDAGIS